MNGLILVLVLAGVIYVSAHIGYVIGRADERNRSAGLCMQALNDRFSGSVRRVLHGIQERRARLMPEDEFFGKQLIEKDQQ